MPGRTPEERLDRVEDTLIALGNLTSNHAQMWELVVRPLRIQVEALQKQVDGNGAKLDAAATALKTLKWVAIAVGALVTFAATLYGLWRMMKQ